MTKAEIVNQLKSLKVPFDQTASKEKLETVLAGVLNKPVSQISSMDIENNHKRPFPNIPGTVAREIPTDEELFELQEKGMLVGYKPQTRMGLVRLKEEPIKFNWQPIKR